MGACGLRLHSRGSLDGDRDGDRARLLGWLVTVNHRWPIGEAVMLKAIKGHGRCVFEEVLRVIFGADGRRLVNDDAGLMNPSKVGRHRVCYKLDDVRIQLLHALVVGQAVLEGRRIVCVVE